MKNSPPSKTELRHQAEVKLSRQKPMDKADVFHLIHELQVHQIELEMQNDELAHSRAEAEESYRQYNDLYDFSPVGYFTLGRDGAIQKANLACGNLIGLERGKLINRRMVQYISESSLPHFNALFEELLLGQGMRTRELEFRTAGKDPLWTQIEATCFEGGPVSLAVAMNISQRKQVEDELRAVKTNLEAANIELQKALSRETQLAYTDVLTGINNRRHLFELAEREYEISVRYHQPLSVIMCDIDHFKQVNDSFGHAAGDHILQLVTQIACKELRSSDVIGRYGGEEFVIVMPMTKAEQAFLLAERIRTEIALLQLQLEKGTASVTLSIGIAEMIHSPQTQSAEELINRADRSMYAAKEAGRNRTVILAG